VCRRCLTSARHRTCCSATWASTAPPAPDPLTVSRRTPLARCSERLRHRFQRRSWAAGGPGHRTPGWAQWA
jgi:hypothetical protein